MQARPLACRRSRSPPGGGHRGGGDTFDRSRLLVTDPGAAMAMQQSLAAQMQQQQLAAMQQQELQKQLLAQQMMMPGGLAAAAAGGQQSQLETLHRKQREVYIGNLAIGIITKDLLQEFWDQARRQLGAGQGGAPDRLVAAGALPRLLICACLQQLVAEASTV